MADSLWGDAPGAPPSARPELFSADASGDRRASSDAVAYIAATVERGAAAMSDNPKPAYPSDLVKLGVEAHFSVFFVVDTTGRVDPTTIEVPPSVDARFAAAVREVLGRWHFIPAEADGHRVRQLMEQPFVFRIVIERAVASRD